MNPFAILSGFIGGRSQGKEEDIICNRQREVNGHTVTNEILWHASKSYENYLKDKSYLKIIEFSYAFTPVNRFKEGI